MCTMKRFGPELPDVDSSFSQKFIKNAHADFLIADEILNPGQHDLCTLV